MTFSCFFHLKVDRRVRISCYALDATNSYTNRLVGRLSVLYMGNEGFARLSSPAKEIVLIT